VLTSINLFAAEYKSPKKLLFFSETGELEVVIHLPPIKVNAFYNYKNKHTCEKDLKRHPLFAFDLDASLIDAPFYLNDADYLIWGGDSSYGYEGGDMFYFVDVEFDSVKKCLSKNPMSGAGLRSVSLTFVNKKERALFPVFGKTFKLKWDLVDGSAQIYVVEDLNRTTLQRTGVAIY
jgi:hypothetical protein